MLTKSTVLQCALPPAEASQKIAAITRPSKAAADAGTCFTGSVGGNAFSLRRLPSQTWNADERDGSWAQVAGRIEPSDSGSTIALRFTTPADVVALTIGILGGAALLIFLNTGGRPLLHPLHAVWILLAAVILPYVFFGFGYDARKIETLLRSTVTDSAEHAESERVPAAPVTAANRTGRIVMGAVIATAGAALMVYGFSLIATPASSVGGLLLSAIGVVLVSAGVGAMLFRPKARA